MAGKGLNPYQQYYWNASNAYDLPQTACVSIGFVLEGELDVSAFSRAVDAVVNRHEQLNSLFRETAEGVRRFPQAAVQDVLRVGSESFEMSRLDANIEALCQIPLDLKTDIPFRAYLNPVDHERYLLALIIHHIVVDSWSLEVILDDLGNAYNRALHGVAEPLLPTLSFDHEILVAPLKPEERQRQVQFWRDYLRDAKIPRIPDLSVAESAQAKSIFDVITPSRETHEALNQLCNALDVTPFVVYTAAASIALARFCSLDDLLIQTNVTPRWEEGTQTVVSYLSARIPLRIRVDSALVLQAQILSVADALYETFENVSLSIGDMMTVGGITESLPIHIGAESPFESWNLENVTVSQVQLPDYQPWPLFLWVPVSSEHSFIKLQYQADRISAGDMAMLKHLLIETLERFSRLSEVQPSRDPEASSHAAVQ
ncbi:condensation domain-containing protein [Pseudomonas sp. NPDC087639]|uniref:condensation domain-containing protein n=1 Tax=Pseudomonas sp. NPDC087639 TaxID=3364445 RepID=UPI00382FE4D0